MLIFNTMYEYVTSSEFVNSLIPNLFAGLLIFLMGLYWKNITFYYKRELRRFRLLFGTGSVSDEEVFITLETYRFDRSSTKEPMPFYKIFPGSHVVKFTGPDEEIHRYCSSRAAAHLIEGFRNVTNVSPKLISDTESIPKWQATFINIGTSATNKKSDDIKKLPENIWLEDDINGFKFKDQTEELFESNIDKAIVLKLPNPRSPDHTLFICSGQKEWGTSGAAWFLSKHWGMLSYRFGNKPFLIVLKVSLGSDESAHEIKFYGKEKKLWPFYSRLYKYKSSFLSN